MIFSGHENLGRYTTINIYSSFLPSQKRKFRDRKKEKAMKKA